MSINSPLIHCPNSACSQPLNPLDRKLCESCQTPLVYNYLWVATTAAAQIPIGMHVADRYYVVAPQIWLDTRPDLAPQNPDPLPGAIIPYLRLYAQHLHVPEVYGYAVSLQSTQSEILLLENVPIDATGNLLPSIKSAWSQAQPVLQVSWLWQILQLWKHLAELRVVSSLLVPENIRVEGWRVRLMQLYPDVISDNVRDESTYRQDVLGDAAPSVRASQHLVEKTLASQTLLKPLPQPSLQHLGNCWASWFQESHLPVSRQLQEIYQQMQAPNPSYSAIARQLNHLLLEQSAKLPWQCQVASATDSGPRRQQNEDTCYPTTSLPAYSQPELIENLSIICDGIGGHESGEVASNLAVESLKLLVKQLLIQAAEDTEIIMPDIVANQLAAIIRVTNNLIAAENDEKKRSSRQRMGTTLVMALNLTQQVKTPQAFAHELYIAHVGDSRAYWITPHYCQQLTVDDDVAVREVRTGRSLYRQALARRDAGALTQALGTRDADLLRPTVQRFIPSEDGVLLLCSDGLSDNNLIEQSWADIAEPILTGQVSLESAVQSLINLANQKNGHDNTSVVLNFYKAGVAGTTSSNVRTTSSNGATSSDIAQLTSSGILAGRRVSPEHPVLLNSVATPPDTTTTPSFNTEQLPLYPTNTVAEADPPTPSDKTPPQPILRPILALGLLGLLTVGGVVGLIVWSLLHPHRLPHPELSPNVTPSSSPNPSSEATPSRERDSSVQQ